MVAFDFCGHRWDNPWKALGRLHQHHTLQTTGGVGDGVLDVWMVGRLKRRQRVKGRLAVLLALTPVGWASLSSVEWTGNGVRPVQSEMAPWVPWRSHFCTVLSWAKHWRLLAHLPVELKLGSAPASTLQRRFACPPCLANSYSLVPGQELSWLCILHSVICCVPNSWLINAI